MTANGAEEDTMATKKSDVVYAVKCCPHCSSEEVLVQGDPPQVLCRDCGMAGPQVKDETAERKYDRPVALAVKAWNRIPRA